MTISGPYLKLCMCSELVIIFINFTICVTSDLHDMFFLFNVDLSEEC